MKITKTQIRQVIKEVMAEESSVGTHEEEIDKYREEMDRLGSELRQMLFKHVRDEHGNQNRDLVMEMGEIMKDMHVACTMAIWHAKRVKR